jgi:hypothetical protein
MRERESARRSINDSRSEAELLKLRLEIDGLRHKNKWENRISVYIPLASVLLAVGGFLFGIYQFQSQQRLQQDRTILEQQKDRLAKEREQAIRIQAQIRDDVDQLLRFTTNKDMTIARASFLLNDLKRLCSYSGNEEQVDSVSGNKLVREVTKSLVEMVRSDCDFDSPRDLELVEAIMNDWEDYLKYLKDEPDTVSPLLDKYINAFMKLHKATPQSVEAIRYNPDTSTYENCPCNCQDDPTFHHFSLLQDGFDQHLDLLKKNTEQRVAFIRYYQGALCNPALTEQVYGESFTDVDCNRVRALQAVTLRVQSELDP